MEARTTWEGMVMCLQGIKNLSYESEIGSTFAVNLQK
jgi:hypothetical protein